MTTIYERLKAEWAEDKEKKEPNTKRNKRRNEIAKIKAWLSQHNREKAEKEVLKHNKKKEPTRRAPKEMNE